MTENNIFFEYVLIKLDFVNVLEYCVVEKEDKTMKTITKTMSKLSNTQKG